MHSLRVRCFFSSKSQSRFFETVDFAQDRELVEAGLEFELLVGLEIVAVATHQREQAAVLGAGGIDLAPTGQEVMVDEADDVEAIGDDLGFGKVLADDRAVDARQVHTDDADAVFAR